MGMLVLGLLTGLILWLATLICGVFIGYRYGWKIMLPWKRYFDPPQWVIDALFAAEDLKRDRRVDPEDVAYMLNNASIILKNYAARVRTHKDKLGNNPRHPLVHKGLKAGGGYAE